MWKNFLSKLPKHKSSKSESNDSPKVVSSSNSNNGGNVLQPRISNNNNTNGNVVTSRSNSGKRTSSLIFPSSVVVGIDALVPFNDVPSTEKLNLFISKLSLCCVVYDFMDQSKCLEEKELKRNTLLELVEFLGSSPPKFTEPAILVMCKMCCNNLFRDFPPNCKANSGGGEDDDDDEPMFDPSWSHLQIVYDLLLKFVTSPSLEAKTAKKYVNHAFILKLLDLFDSEDPREREFLKTVMHRIYGKFMVHRPFIRSCFGNIFFRYAFENGRLNGIAELLEIFGSVISGFAVPLKEEHKMFLCRALIPLHKSKSLGIYFQQLSYCITQFIEKEPKLASTVIRGLLKYWPVTNSQKEVMFIGEIEEILEGVSMGEFQKIMVPLFWRIGRCINSSHFQVAERALYLWNNDQIMNLIAPNRHVIVPIIFPALEKNTETHWNQSVLNLTLNVSKMLNEMDEVLFSACRDHAKEEQAKISVAEEKRREAWLRLENAASLQPIGGNTAVLVTPLAISTC